MNKIPKDFSFSNKNDLKKYNKSVKTTSSERINQMKFRILQSLLKPHIKNAKILDLGCGDAFYLKSLLKKGMKNYTGIDTSKLMIDKAKITYKNKKNIELIAGDMTDDKISQDNYYNCVLSIYSLMRISDIDKIFKIVNNKIRKNGIFIIMTNTYVIKNNANNFIVKIKKNNEVFFNNYARSSEVFISTAYKNGFTMLCSFNKPFSKDKIIISPNPKEISGYDSILMFKKD